MREIMKFKYLVLALSLIGTLFFTGCYWKDAQIQENSFSKAESQEIALQYLSNMNQFKEMNGHDTYLISEVSVKCPSCYLFNYKFLAVSEKDSFIFDNVNAQISVEKGKVSNAIISRGVIENILIGDFPIKDIIDNNIIPTEPNNGIGSINYATECENIDGTWISEHNECEFISLESCNSLGGVYYECGSACRHDESDEIIACIEMCVPYCKFEIFINSDVIDLPIVGLANPASVYCNEQGGSLELINDEDGSYGLCTLLDGTVCEEWAYFRGECGSSDNGEFCGSSTEGSCEVDSDCIQGGCSGQICQSKNEEGIITTCEYLDCYNAKEYGLGCGCVQGSCVWN